MLVLLLAAGALSAISAAAEERSITLPVIEGESSAFIHLSAERGLLRRAVYQILQDDQGFIWLGTRDGLRRYDGFRLRSYRNDPENPRSISGTRVMALFKDRAGKLWIGVGAFLDIYDPKTDSFTQFSPDPQSSGAFDGPAYHINEDRDRMIWVATDHGLSRIDPANWQTIRYQHIANDPSSLSDSSIKATLEEPDGTFWVATAKGVDIFDRQSEKVITHFPIIQGPGERGTRLLLDHAGVLWAASQTEAGITSIDRSANRITHYSFDLQSKPVTGTCSMYEDQDGNLWVGTVLDGLFKLDRSRSQLLHYGHDPSDPDSLSADHVTSVFGDKEGNIWAGTVDGVNRLIDVRGAYSRYRHEPGNANSLAPGTPLSVFEDSRGELWVGTEAALNRIERNTGEITQFRGEREDQGPPTSAVTSMAEDRSGYLWFGTYDGLYRFDPSVERFKAFRRDPSDASSLSDSSVPSLLVDRGGTLWVGTMDGLNAFEPETETFQVFRAPGNEQASIWAMAEDSQGTLWLGTSNDGLQRFDPDSGEFTVYRSQRSVPGSLSSNQVHAICVDSFGAIWIGTASGLNRFDPETQTFTVYYERDGLPNNFVTGILENDRSSIWVMTANGLSIFDTAAQQFSNFYTPEDGLTRHEFLAPHTGWRSPSGEVFMNSMGGVSALSSAFSAPTVNRSHRPSYSPPLVVTDIKLFGEPLPIGDQSPLKQSISLTKALVLPHAQDTLSLEVSALVYAYREQSRLKYRLQGLESTWNEVTGAHAQATYTRLSPGDYVFQAQWADNRGIWNDQSVELQLRISPPWWAAWWFRILALACLSVLVVLAYRWRLRMAERQAQIRLSERFAERSRIARELHDTLLQGVNGLVFRLQAARNLLPQRPAEATQLLDGVITSTAEAVSESRKAIQDLRAEPVERGELTDLLMVMGNELASAGNGRSPNFRTVVEGQRRALKPVIHEEVYRIGCELLQNAFRHAQAREVVAEVRYNGRSFCLSIRDDGKGMDPEVRSENGNNGHWGLTGIRERAEQVGANLVIESEEGTGTYVQLSLPASIAYFRHRSRIRSTLLRRGEDTV